MAMKKPEVPKNEMATPAYEPTKSGGGKQKKRSSSFVISSFSTFVFVPTMAMKKPEVPKKEKAPSASEPTKSGGGKQKKRKCRYTRSPLLRVINHLFWNVLWLLLEIQNHILRPWLFGYGVDVVIDQKHG
nr:hypothetical protein [Tanacetum cinerariifolium]